MNSHKHGNKMHIEGKINTAHNTICKIGWQISPLMLKMIAYF